MLHGKIMNFGSLNKISFIVEALGLGEQCKVLNKSPFISVKY
jgi:hypothetical protein